MKKSYLISLVIFVLLFSCEDIIEVDLNDTEPQLVIEGTISNLDGPYQVRLSESTDFYDPGIYPPVTGAIVEISDDAGNREVLREDGEGIYLAENILGESGRSYNLQVSVNGENYSAKSYMEPAVKIDSIKPEYFPDAGFRESGFYLHCYFDDPSDTTNYYRLRAYVNGVMDEALYLLDDSFIDGNTVDYYLFFATYQPGDTALVELLSIDDKVYDYYLTLSNIVNEQGGGNPSNPANPNSNLTNGALGYFGALAIDSVTLVIDQ